MNTIELLSPSGTKDICITEKNSDTLIRIIDFDGTAEKTFFRLNIHGDKNAENANIRVVARYLTQAQQKKECTISLFLHGKNQTGNINIKGIAEDTSFLYCNGGGMVTKTSTMCSIEIGEKIYLFSEKAKAKAIPVLRVETDNIASASHSASIAPFPDDIFFYMGTRGISYDNAKELLRYSIQKKK